MGIGLAAAFITGCAPHKTAPKVSPVPARTLTVREGLASYYGADFQGKRTASGVKFDMNAMVAAHPRYPFGTLLRVTNLANGRAVDVRVNDRGPFIPGRILDVSRGVAVVLDAVAAGVFPVELVILDGGPDLAPKPPNAPSASAQPRRSSAIRFSAPS